MKQYRAMQQTATSKLRAIVAVSHVFRNHQEQERIKEHRKTHKPIAAQLYNNHPTEIATGYCFFWQKPKWINAQYAEWQENVLIAA